MAYRPSCCRVLSADQPSSSVMCTRRRWFLCPATLTHHADIRGDTPIQRVFSWTQSMFSLAIRSVGRETYLAPLMEACSEMPVDAACQSTETTTQKSIIGHDGPIS